LLARVVQRRIINEKRGMEIFFINGLVSLPTLVCQHLTKYEVPVNPILAGQKPKVRGRRSEVGRGWRTGGLSRKPRKELGKMGILKWPTRTVSRNFTAKSRKGVFSLMTLTTDPLTRIGRITANHTKYANKDTEI